MCTISIRTHIRPCRMVTERNLSNRKVSSYLSQFSFVSTLSGGPETDERDGETRTLAQLKSFRHKKSLNQIKYRLIWSSVEEQRVWRMLYRHLYNVTYYESLRVSDGMRCRSFFSFLLSLSLDSFHFILYVVVDFFLLLLFSLYSHFDLRSFFETD